MATVHALTTFFFAVAMSPSRNAGDALFAHRARSQQVVMLSVRECLYLRPGLARHSRVVVHFEHPKNGQDAKTCFRILRFREIQILSKQAIWLWDRSGGFAVRRHLADTRVEGLGELMPLSEFLLGLPVKRFRCQSSC